jgi:hypothetical protein
MSRKTVMFALFALSLLWTIASAVASTQKEQVVKVGKRGEITLTKPTKVDGIVLQPDTYVIQHRTFGGNHFVRFVELKQMEAQPATELPYTYTEADKAGEIPCRVEPATGTIKETRAYIVTESGEPRITKVEIKGEDVVHVF